MFCLWKFVARVVELIAMVPTVNPLSFAIAQLSCISPLGVASMVIIYAALVDSLRRLLASSAADWEPNTGVWLEAQFESRLSMASAWGTTVPASKTHVSGAMAAARAASSTRRHPGNTVASCPPAASIFKRNTTCCENTHSLEKEDKILVKGLHRFPLSINLLEERLRPDLWIQRSMLRRILSQEMAMVFSFMEKNFPFSFS